MGDNWIYHTDEFAEARAISTMTCQTILQYFPEGGHVCDLLLMAVTITEEDADSDWNELV